MNMYASLASCMLSNELILSKRTHLSFNVLYANYTSWQIVEKFAAAEFFGCIASTRQAAVCLHVQAGQPNSFAVASTQHAAAAVKLRMRQAVDICTSCT